LETEAENQQVVTYRYTRTTEDDTAQEHATGMSEFYQKVRP